LKALEAIIDGIKKEEQHQIQRIEADAEKSVSLINEKARSEVDIQKRRILSDGKMRLNRDKALIEQQVQMRILQVHADARQYLINSALEKVWERFDGIRGMEIYRQVLKRLIEESITAIQPSLIDHQKTLLRLDERDKILAEQILESLRDHIVVQYDIKSYGGCIAETEDCLITVKNTIDSRFQHAASYIQQDLSIFFEKKFDSN